jgi:hypothetical protein
MSTAPTKLVVTAKTLKLYAPVTPEQIPSGYADGHPVVEVTLAGTNIVVSATLNPQTVRRSLRAYRDAGPDGAMLSIQGTVKAGPDGKLILDGAALMSTIKTVKPAPASPPPGGPASPQSNVT